VKKQGDVVAKLRDLTLEQQATGMVEPEVVMASEKVMQAVAEQIPYLKQVMAGVDGSSPVALLEFQKMVGGGSLKELVALGASIVTDAAKGLGGKKDEGKEAAKKAEDKDEDEALLAEMLEEEAKTASKKAEDKDESEEVEKTEDEDKSEDKDETEDSKKSAATNFGYDLFSR